MNFYSDTTLEYHATRQDMTPSPVTVFRYRADMWLCYPWKPQQLRIYMS